MALRVFTGNEFNDAYQGRQFCAYEYKFTSNKRPLKDGLTINPVQDFEKFTLAQLNEGQKCMYFYTLIDDIVSQYESIRLVTIPDDAKVCVYINEYANMTFVADKMILSKKKYLKTDPEFVEFSSVANHYLRTEDINRSLVMKNPSYIKNIKNQTEELCKIAIMDSPKNIIHVLTQTVDICMLAVKKDGLMLEHVENKFKTPDVCYQAVKQIPIALQYVPQDRQTKELCEAAVKSNGKSLYFVDEKFFTSEMCELAVRSNGMALAYIGQDIENYDSISLLAVKENGLALEFVPKDKTVMLNLAEIQFEAVKQNGSALKFVELDDITEELCELAVLTDGLMLEYASKRNFLNDQMCLNAVKQNGLAIKYANVMTDNDDILINLCEEAVKSNPNTLEIIVKTPVVFERLNKYEDKINAIYLSAVKKNGLILYHIPSSKITKELEEAAKNCVVSMPLHYTYYTTDGYPCINMPLHYTAVKYPFVNELEYCIPDNISKMFRYDAEKQCYVIENAPRISTNVFAQDDISVINSISENGLNIQYSPKLTPELCMLAVKQNGLALQYIPATIQTKELCEEAVKQNGLALVYVSMGLQSADIRKIAVQQNGFAIKYVGSANQTAELCKQAITQNVTALEFIFNMTADLWQHAITTDKERKYVSDVIDEKFRYLLESQSSWWRLW